MKICNSQHLTNSNSLIIEETDRDEAEEIFERIASLNNLQKMINYNLSSIKITIDKKLLQNNIKEEKNRYKEFWNKIYKKYNIDTNFKCELTFDNCSLKIEK